MTTPHAFISSALISGIVFITTTFPLAMMGSQPVTIKISEKPLFSGRLEELANPYLGFTTILSLGTGLATFGLLGWQFSSRRLNHAEEQITALKQQLQEKEALLEHLKFSETRLQTAGLSLFLEPEAVGSQSAPMSPLKVQSIQVERQLDSFSNISVNHQTDNQKPSIQSFIQDGENLHDTTQMEGLIAHLKQVMSQIEKLQISQAQNVV